MKLIEHFVGGKLFSGSSDRKGKVFNPATGEQESEVNLASKSDLNQAVEIAKKAFETWSLKPPLQSCLLYTSPSPRDVEESRMPSSA